jgi:signal transduction histidine kinase
MGRFLRNYTILSLVAILVGLVLFVVTYRLVAVSGIVELAQQNTLTYGKTALRQIDVVLGDYLDSAATFSDVDARNAPLPAALSTAMTDLMRDRGVVRVKIYNSRGLVVYSSSRDQIGNDQSDNAAFRSAMSGEVTAELVYRDSFNPFDRVTEDDNLVQTYIPVRPQSSDPVKGVLELYTDVNNLVHQAEQSEFRILAVGAVILPLLWGAMFYFVRRTAGIVAAQQKIIRERSATLAELSAHMLQSEEAERKRLAVQLHEGLAQTLSAIKLALEGADSHPRTGVQRDDAVVPLLQRTIGEIRNMAMELRPPALDDLGLLPAISAVCREVRASFPHLEIVTDFDVKESAIPDALRIVLYRSLTIALYAIARTGQARLLRIGLWSQGEEVVLTMQHDGRAESGTDPSGVRDKSGCVPIDALRERVILTGGELSLARDGHGWTTLRMRWPR